MSERECRVWSEELADDVMDINQCAVLGALAEGFGYSQLNGLLACMGIPYVSDKSFKSQQEMLLLHLQKISAASMRKAAEGEKRLAIRAGDVDANSTPFITVIVDGSWLKRSFGTKYDSLSGLGAIIGYRTGKVLFVGVENKYCTKCHRAERCGKTPGKHNCCKNFPRDSPSTLMESQALLEGFQQSLKDYGLVYRYFIGDGDSNFYKKLHDTNPYKDLNILPHKIECTNHLLRNLCKHLTKISTTTLTSAKRNRGYVALRNLIKKNILKLREAVVTEVDRLRIDNTLDRDAKVACLRNRILHIPHHIFSDHRKCSTYGIECGNPSDASKKQRNCVPFFRAVGLFQKVDLLMQKLSHNSDSLLYKVTNNIVESFNNIICKIVGSKRINYACSNQYNTRVAIAVLQHNSQQALTEIFKGMRKQIPDTVEMLERMRKQKVARTRQDRVMNGRKRRYVHGTADKNYGTECEVPDLPPDQVQKLRKFHFDKLNENLKNRVQIEIDTREQSNSDLWLSIRKILLTASNFGRICRMRPYTLCSNMVKSILYPTLSDNPAMKYGRDSEPVAIEELSKIIGKTIVKNGLFIDAEDSRFAASPDGLIDDDGIVEVKNPYCAQDISAEEARAKHPHLNYVDKRTGGMKKTHIWYYQVQGQLHVTKRDYCIFALRTPQDIEYLRIERDDKFWETEMEPKLSAFYENCLLPEILDPRYLRNMKSRNPDYILQEKEKRDAALAEKRNKE